ncbi:DUF2165 family protein [Citrobacter werkmanii]|uniref:DUF2165 family protein n=1 Tax=Citrobacter werkmanii TaxID=67827 RepID=UPI00271BA6CD|nr:DUF2165 family protein [Citrobacter werkmanii]MDO8235834.1 DUF2165 family protein [Citrobacter werkmanii]
MKYNILPKTVIMAGMALWMSSIVFNNIFDSGTNIYNINNTITMSLLKDDPVLGLGLKWRAWPDGYAPLILKCVIAYQLVIVCSFWFSAYRYMKAFLGKIPEASAIRTSNIALIIFSIHWFGFLCGGTWFGYWIKQGAFTGVHTMMLLMNIVLFIFINQTVNECDTR